MQQTALTFKEQFSAVKASLGGVLFYLFLVVYLINAFFMVWVPANDFDTMSSYLARIKLEEFGPLKETATLEIQYLFPRFFDYLHKPFLKFGYFTTFPNFCLFTITLLVLIRGFPTKQAAWGLVLLFFCPSVLMTMTAAKNDISLSLFSFLAWYVISTCQNSRFYLVISLSLLAMLAGTKWHGVAIAGILGLYLTWNFFTQKEHKRQQALIALLALPLYVFFSSLQTYMTNYHHYGSFMPRPVYMQRGFSIPFNFVELFVSQLMDTIEAPLHIIELLVKGSVSTLNYGFGKADRSLLIGASDFNTCGILLLLVMGTSFFVLFRRQATLAERVPAFLCLFYVVLITCLFPYDTFINRYYLTAYILGIIPTMSLCDKIAPKEYRGWLVVFFLIFSSYAVLTNSEKRLVQIKVGEQGNITRYKPMYTRLSDRDSLYFNVWTGYQSIFDFMKSHIQSDQSLLIINSAQDGDVPFIYPLIKDREGKNTHIINVYYHPQAPLNTETLQADFIMTYRQGPPLPHYKLVYHLHPACDEICIYEHV